jgi:hypothetical protein
MGLCRVCGKPVRMGSARCPNCGIRNPAPTRLSQTLMVAALCAILALILYLLFRR